MTRRRPRRSINEFWLMVPPESAEARPYGDEDGQDARGAALQAPWRADAEMLAHREPQVEAAAMNQQTLQDVVVSPTSPVCTRGNPIARSACLVHAVAYATSLGPSRPAWPSRMPAAGSQGSRCPPAGHHTCRSFRGILRPDDSGSVLMVGLVHHASMLPIDPMPISRSEY